MENFGYRLPGRARTGAYRQLTASVFPLRSVGGLRLTFSGSQPENCEPLVQFVPAQENMEYEPSYKTYGMAAVSGLEWRVTELSGGRALVAGIFLSAEREEAGRVSFVTPASCHSVRLAPAYKRVPGTTRVGRIHRFAESEVQPGLC